MRFVHKECLNRWRFTSRNARSFVRCDQCNAAYRMRRTRWAHVLESRAVIDGTTVLVLSCLALLSSALVPRKWCEWFYDLIMWRPPRALVPVSNGCLALAAMGVTIATSQARMANRDVAKHWYVAPLVTILTSDVRILRVFVLLGGMTALCATHGRVRDKCKELLVHWGTDVLDRNEAV